MLNSETDSTKKRPTRTKVIKKTQPTIVSINEKTPDLPKKEDKDRSL